MGLGQENQRSPRRGSSKPQSHPVRSGRSPQLRSPSVPVPPPPFQPVDAVPLEMMPPEEKSPDGGEEVDRASSLVLLQALKSGSTRKVRARQWGCHGWGVGWPSHLSDGPWGWWSPVGGGGVHPGHQTMLGVSGQDLGGLDGERACCVIEMGPVASVGSPTQLSHSSSLKLCSSNPSSSTGSTCKLTSDFF